MVISQSVTLRSFVLATMLLLFVGQGCGHAKMSVRVKHGPQNKTTVKPPASKVTPNQSNHHQSNSKITPIWDMAQSSSFFRFRIEKVPAGTSHTVEVLDNSTGAIILNSLVGEPLSGPPGFWVTQEVNSVLVTIDPGEESVAAAMKVGTNSVTVFVDGETDDDDNFNLSLEDFTLFSVGSSSFPDGPSGVEPDGPYLQAWTSPLASTTVSTVIENGSTVAPRSGSQYLNSSFLDILSSSQD